MNHLLKITAISLILILSGCGGGSTGPTNSYETVASEKNITVYNSGRIEYLGKGKKIKLNITMQDTSKDLYLLFTNHDRNLSDIGTSVTGSVSKVSPATRKNEKISIEKESKPHPTHAPMHILQFAKDMHLLPHTADTLSSSKKAAPVTKTAKRVGDTEAFYIETDQSVSTDATLRKISAVTTQFGDKTLNIWVSNDAFDSGSGCPKTKCVTQTMVDELSEAFLTDGDDNDIYDWVTNVFGEKWGSSASEKYNNVIEEDNEITILLTDIDNDNSDDGGTIGYFYGKDNFVTATYSGSNERIMFYADSVMYANRDAGDYWQKEMYSTLAHEFQHMIHFYQKTLLLADSNATDEWINEMLSETTEDLVATKLEHQGPRGVEYTDGSAGSAGNTEGRYPLFNQYNSLSLSSWSNRLADYSKVSAFGTFLTRNYGGAKVLRDIVYNNKVHADSIETATGKSFEQLLRDWGVAVILSDYDSLPDSPPKYNTGDFTEDTYNNSTYQLGSINFYNYDPAPVFKTTSPSTIEASANYYYKIGANQSGTVTVEIDASANTEVTFIAK